MSTTYVAADHETLLILRCFAPASPGQSTVP
jgi:hypothetical protein